jgi:hypothetical protein
MTRITNKEIEREWYKLDNEGKARYNGFIDFKDRYFRRTDEYS